MPRRRRKSFVAGEQRRVERFGERDIDGIVGREIVPQLPDARQKEIVWIALHRKVGEIMQRRTAALVADLAIRRISADDLRDLDVEQMRRMQRLPLFEEPPLDCFCRGGTKERFEQGRSVDDDHRLSRSARTARAGAMEGVTLGRRSRRARNSSIVGRSADWRIRPSR